MSDHHLKNSAAANALLPIAPTERIEAIDVLRGVAILGVLIAYTVWNLGGPPEEMYGTVDKVLEFVLVFLIESKAYTLLAFLFGVGFSIQLARAGERSANIVPLYCRRLLALTAIGLVHALLLRNGDILVPYATMGFVLLAFRNASDRTLIIAALVSSFVRFAAEWLWDISGIPFPARPDTASMSYLASNLAWVKYWYATAITFWPGSLPMFFAGLYVGRSRILENVSEHRQGIKRVLIVGLAFGILIFAGRLLLVQMIGRPSGPSVLLNFLLVYGWSVHAWALAAFYASSLLLLLERPTWKRLLSPFAAFGRMALTNYLLQSIVFVPICIAFNLFDTVTPTKGLLMALALFALQVPASIVWLRYFRFGPAEWLWRSLTYGKAQPMRLARADDASDRFSMTARESAGSGAVS